MRPASGELSPSAAEHLVAIAELRSERGYARVSDVARQLSITRGSASLTLKSLKQKGFVAEDDNRFLVLTDKGRVQAENNVEKKALLYRLLERVLGCPTDVASKDSRALSHSLSPESASRLARFLGALESETPEAESLRQALATIEQASLVDK